MGTITINGRELPCRITMGAFILFREQTGREANEITSNALSDMIIFIWCCTKSACRADKVEFDLSLEEFADAADPACLNAFYAQAAEDDGKKKEQTGSLNG